MAVSGQTQMATRGQNPMADTLPATRALQVIALVLNLLCLRHRPRVFQIPSRLSVIPPDGFRGHLILGDTAGLRGMAYQRQRAVSRVATRTAYECERSRSCRMASGPVVPTPGFHLSHDGGSAGATRRGPSRHQGARASRTRGALELPTSPRTWWGATGPGGSVLGVR